jgi:nucleoside-diphosphate-sugar epimerase
MGEFSEALTRRVNFEGTMHLARIAKKAGVRSFLFAGSCSVYGKRGDAALTERDPVDPQTAYARSKVDAERALLSLASRDFSVVLLRNATAYGESPNLRLDLVVNNLAAHAYTEGRILIKSDGTPWRPVIHVEDMARALIAFLESETGRFSGEIFNVGSMEQNYRVSQIATQIQEAFPACGVEYSPEADKDSRSYCVDFSKLRQAMPGFACRRTVGETAGALRRAFGDIRLDAESFVSDRFIRLKALQGQLLGKA